MRGIDLVTSHSHLRVAGSRVAGPE